ncbi:hypothetical protein QBC43DRAFT_332971 [Cladorrhinum sp. PSN259]|nr:hypothetical protein QBC43DRAFT_332971 [Cladorrhinum sp. PSN259]
MGSGGEALLLQRPTHQLRAHSSEALGLLFRGTLPSASEWTASTIIDGYELNWPKHKRAESAASVFLYFLRVQQGIDGLAVTSRIVNRDPPQRKGPRRSEALRVSSTSHHQALAIESPLSASGVPSSSNYIQCTGRFYKYNRLLEGGYCGQGGSQKPVEQVGDFFWGAAYIQRLAYDAVYGNTGPQTPPHPSSLVSGSPAIIPVVHQRKYMELVPFPTKSQHGNHQFPCSALLAMNHGGDGGQARRGVK